MGRPVQKKKYFPHQIPSQGLTKLPKCQNDDTKGKCIYLDSSAWISLQILAYIEMCHVQKHVVELGNPMVASDKSFDQIQNQNCENDLTWFIIE